MARKGVGKLGVKMTFEDHEKTVKMAAEQYNKAVSDAKRSGYSIKSILSSDGASIYRFVLAKETMGYLK